MRKSHTAAMEIFAAKANGPVATEPYEAGWAREALAVIYCHEAHGPAPRLELRAQISADGVRWIDFGHALPAVSEPGGAPPTGRERESPPVPRAPPSVRSTAPTPSRRRG